MLTSITKDTLCTVNDCRGERLNSGGGGGHFTFRPEKVIKSMGTSPGSEGMDGKNSENLA
jgi:hypothetical protein